jgi:putative ABC transport system permease protein
MKYLYLLWRNLTRKKIRTIFTFLSVVVAFFLFGGLMAVKYAFEAGVDLAGQHRLLTQHKLSIIQPLPVRHEREIEQIPGVADATGAIWFNGIYIDKKNFFAQFGIDPGPYLDMYPEMIIPDDQRERFIATRTGALAGRKLAARFGWAIGDRIPIQATYWRPQDGSSSTYEFDLVAIYEGGADETNFFFHYEYAKERAGDPGIVGWYMVAVEDPERSDEVANAIDARFENSAYETKTATEKAFMRGFAKQIGNTGAMLVAISAIVFFVLLLIAGNTMAQAVRERTAEVGVMKTLGFSDLGVLAMVLAESLLLSVPGGAIGLVAVWLLAPGMALQVQQFFPVFRVPEYGLVAGAVLMVLLGIVSGLMPAAMAMRLRIADALRRV